MLSALLLLLTLGAAAQAGTTLPPKSGAYDQAEYYRLTQELHSLARRQAWEGVERAYESIVKLSVPASFEDHVAAAHAAAARGDTWAVHDRLKAAHALQEDREIIEWLWKLDTEYVEVHVLAQPGDGLSIDQMPFDPHAFMAVAFAMGAVQDDGAYRGYLPAGTYHLEDEAFELRSGDGPRELVRVPADDDKRGKKKKDKR